MKLREYLNVVFNTGAVFKVMSTLEQVYYQAEKQSITEISSKYTKVAQELLDLPGLPGCNDHYIELTRVCDPDEEYIDVHLKSQTSKETYSISYVDWADIIDSSVVTEQKLDLTDIVAHILWEITFHGWTRKEILLAEDKLRDIIDEAKTGDTISYDVFKKELFSNSCDLEPDE
jgi:hypothetical protein